jgi:hypothetical protein
MSAPVDRADFLGKFDVLLDASAPDFGAQLRAALGLAEGESVEIITPQFTRTDGRVVSYFPRTVEEFDALKLLPEATLKALGLGVWDRDNGVHWLYPSEWYSCIPEGYELTSISGKRSKFKAGETDDDSRYGCLAYGFIVPGPLAPSSHEGTRTDASDASRSQLASASPDAEEHP